MDKIRDAILPDLAHRSRQLQTEQQIDTKLKKLPCDDIVRYYYETLRRWNREAYQRAHNDVWNYRQHTADNLSKIDTHHEEVQTALDSDCPCRELFTITTRFAESIDHASSPTDTD